MGQSTDSIRNIAIAGHGGTGKTSLTEQMLFVGGSIQRPETVENGRTISDYSSEEIDRKMSIHTSLSSLSWKETKINLLDTPGAPDFIGEVVSAYRAAEASVLVVGARSGVQIETIKLWRRLNNRHMPRMVFINKLEKANTDFFSVMEDLKDKFDTTFIPVTIPIGHDVDYEGVINLLDMKAYYFTDQGHLEDVRDIPENMKEQADKYRLILVEEAAEGDEELLDKYVEEGTLSTEEIKKGLHEGLTENLFVPVFCGSALLNSGIAPLLDFIAFDSPCPFRVEEPCITGEKSRFISPEGEFSGYVFKTSIDQFSGKLSYVKVITGVLKPGTEAYNPREEKKEKITKIYKPMGKNITEVTELSAGDMGILAKIDSVRTNDTLCQPDDIIHYKSLALPQPTYSLTISAGSQKEEDKMAQLLGRKSEEDLTFQVRFNPETKETVMSGMGELQFGLILDTLRKNNKIEVQTKVPKIAYRETLTRAAEAEYTHKKQTGGHGQFGRVVLRIEPLPRGEDFQFVNEIKGGSISKGYMPGLEKGIKEGMSEGFLAGYPVVDMKVTILDGKEHPVDSSEMAFKLAGKGAFKEAMGKAGAIMLEPIMNLRVFIEDQFMGDVLSDLSSKRGRVMGQEPIGGGITEIDAQVPQAELLRYSIDLRSITSGTGAFEVEFSHYDPFSGKEAEELIKQHKELVAAGH